MNLDVLKRYILGNQNDFEGNGYESPIEMAVVNDITAPVLDVSRDIETPMENETVEVTVDIEDESTISQVILSHSTDSGHSWFNTSMTEDDGSWIATIPEYDAGVTVQYNVFAVDEFDNWATSDIQSYTVQEQPPTITSTTSTTSTTGSTTTSTDSTNTNPTGSTEPENPMGSMLVPLIIVSMIAGILVVVVVIFVKKRGMS